MTMTSPQPEPRIHPTIRPGCKIAIVGEAPGANEIVDGRPFTGASGQLLRKMCEAAGLVWEELTLTNVFLARPDGNKIERFFLKVKALKAAGHDPKGRRKHPTHGYVAPDRADELPRLLAELDACGCSVIVACGGVSLWALGFDHAISKHRGVHQKLVLPSGREVTVLGTYHPSAVLREWSYRPIVVADLKKAVVGSDAPRTHRRVRIPQTLGEVRALLAEYMDEEFIAHDIETEARQITCISLARSPTDAIVIPIWDKSKPNYCAWNPSDEILIWKELDRFFSRKRRWLAQNGMYDMTYYLEMGMSPNGVWEDTMLLHHSIYCEQPKSLGFLGSLYADEVSWKELRVKRSKGKDEKKDE